MTENAQPTNAGTAPDYMAMARDAYSESTTYFDGSIRKEVEAGIRMAQGVHPAGSKYHSDLYKARSRVFRPKTRTTIRKGEAVGAEALFSTADVVSVKPEDDANTMQQRAAALMKGLLKYRLKKTIPWFLLAMGAYQDAMTTGVCLSHQYWVFDERTGRDEPCMEIMPVENLRLSPASNWARPIETSPYLIRLIPMYVKDVKAKATRTNPKTGQPAWKMVSEAELLAGMRPGGDSTRMTRERGRQDSQDQPSAITDFTIVWVHENIVEIDGVDVVWYTLGTTAMLTDPVPLKTVYFHGKRPFTMGISVIETHKVYPGGVAALGKDIQGEINEVANQRLDNVKLAMNKRYFVKRGSQVDLRSLVRNVPASVTLMNDPEGDIKTQEMSDVTSSAYQEQDRLNLDYDDIAGSFSPSSVQSNRKLNETVGGMEILNTNTNQVGGYQLRTWVETWAEPALRQLMWLEAYYETNEVILALAGREAQIALDEIDDEIMLQDLVLDIDVGIGATSAKDKIANFRMGMATLREVLADGILERYGLKIEEVIKEIFGNLGYKDGRRFFDAETEDPALTAAKSTITQLQQELAQKVNPELVAAQVRKLDAEIDSLGKKSADIAASAVEKTMRSFFASMQSAQMVAAVPAIAPVADALVKAAGYVQPNPAGIDPNFPQPGGPAAGLTQNAVKDPRTGIEFMPGDGSMPGDTTPSTPASPVQGVNAGIETVEADS